MAVANIKRPRPYTVQLQPSRVYAHSPYRPYVGTTPVEYSPQAKLLDQQMARAIVSPFQINDPNVIGAIRRTHRIEDGGSYQTGQQIGATLGFTAGAVLAGVKYIPVIAGHLGTIAGATSSTGAGVPLGAAIGLAAGIFAIAGVVLTSTQIGKTIGAVASKEGQVAWVTYLRNVGNSFARRPVTAALNLIGTVAIPATISKVPLINKIPGATSVATMYGYKYTSQLGNKIDAGIFGELDENEIMSYTDFRSLRGDLIDGFQGNNIIKATLASISGKENMTDLIARSYGSHKEGYSPLGFNKVREAYGVDFGVFANGLIDMLGEISINTNRWIGSVKTPIRDAITKHFNNNAILSIVSDKKSTLFNHFFEIDKTNKVVDKKFKEGEIGFKQLETSVERIVDGYKDPSLVFTNKEKTKIQNDNNKLILDEASRLATQIYIKESKKINLIQDIKKSAEAKEKLKSDHEKLTFELVNLFNQTLKRTIKPLNESNQSLLEIDSILNRVLDSDKKRNEFNFDLTLLKEIKDNKFLMEGNILEKNLKVNSLLRHQILANQSFYSFVDYLSNPTLAILKNKHVNFALKRGLRKISEVNDPVKINTTMEKLIREERDVNSFQKEFEDKIDVEIKELNKLIQAAKNGKKEEYLEEYFLSKYKMSKEEYLESLNKKAKASNLTKEETEQIKNAIKSIEKEYEAISNNFNEEETLKQYQELLKGKQEALSKLQKTIRKYKEETNGFMYVSSRNKRFKINTKEEKQMVEEELKNLEESLSVEKEILKNLTDEKEANKKHEEINRLENEINDFKNLLSLNEYETIMEEVIRQNMKNLMSINNTISFFEINMLDFKNNLLEFMAYMTYAKEMKSKEPIKERAQTADKSLQNTLGNADFQRNQEKEKRVQVNYEFFRDAFGILNDKDFKTLIGDMTFEEENDLNKLKERVTKQFETSTDEIEREKIAEQLIQIEAKQTFRTLMDLKTSDEITLTMSYGRAILEHLEISGSEIVSNTLPNNVLFLEKLDELFKKDSELIKKIDVFKKTRIGKSREFKLDGRAKEVKELKSLLLKEIDKILTEDSEDELLTKEEKNSIKHSLFESKHANANLNGIMKSFVLMASRNHYSGKEIHEPSRVEKGFNNSKTLFNAFLNEMFFKTVKGRRLNQYRKNLEINLKQFRESLNETLTQKNVGEDEKNLIKAYKNALGKIVYSDFIYGLNYKYFTGNFQEKDTKQERYENEDLGIIEEDINNLMDPTYIYKEMESATNELDKLGWFGFDEETIQRLKTNVGLILGTDFFEDEEQTKTKEELNVETKKAHMEDVINLLIEKNPSMEREDAIAIYGEILDNYKDIQNKLNLKREVERQISLKEKVLKDKIKDIKEQIKLEKDSEKKSKKETVLNQLNKETSSLKKAYKNNKIMSLINIENLHEHILGKTKPISTGINLKLTSKLDQKVIKETLSKDIPILEKIVFLKSLGGQTFRTYGNAFINLDNWKQLDPEFRSQFLDMERMSSEELPEDSNEQIISFFKGQKVESLKDKTELIKTNKEITKLELDHDLNPSEKLKDKLDSLYKKQIELEEKIKNDTSELNLNKNRVPKYIQNIFESSYSIIKQVNNLKDIDKKESKKINITEETKVSNKLSNDLIREINSRGNIKALSIKEANYKNIYFKDNEAKELNVDVLEIQVGQNKFEIFIPKEKNGIFNINGSNYFKQRVMGEDENDTSYLEHFVTALEKEARLFSTGYEKDKIDIFGINYGQSKMQEALMKVFFKQRTFYNEEESGEYMTDFKYLGNNYTEEALAFKLNSIYVPKSIRNKTENRIEDYIKANADFKSTNATGNSAQLNINIEGEWVTPLEVFIPAYKQLNDKNYHRIASSTRSLTNSQKLKSGLNENPLFISKNYKYANIEKGNGINLKVKLDDFYGTYTLKDGREISLSTTNDMSIVRMSAARKLYGDENGVIAEGDLSYFKLEDRYSNKSTTLVVEDDEFDQIFGKGYEVIMSKSSNRDRQSQGQLIEMAFNEKSKGKKIEYDNNKDVYENWKDIFEEEITEKELNQIISGHQYFYVVEDTYNKDDATERLEAKVTGDNVSNNSSAISFEVMSTISAAQNTKIKGKTIDPQGKFLEWLANDSRTKKNFLTFQDLHERSMMLEGSGGRVKQEAMKYYMPNSLDDKLTADPSLNDREMSVVRSHAKEMGILDDNGDLITEEAIFIRYPMKGRDSIVHVKIKIRKDSVHDKGNIGVSESYTKLTNTDFDGDRGTLFALKGASEEIINISKQMFTHDYLLNKDFSDFFFNVNKKHIPSSLKITSAKIKEFNKAYAEDYLNKISTNWSEELDEKGNVIKLTKEEREEKIIKAKTSDTENVTFSYDKEAKRLEDAGLRSHKVKEYAAKNQHLVDWISSIYLLDDKFNYWFENEFLQNEKFNILGVTDIAAIFNLSREFLGQDAFDFAKRGAEDSKLLDKMYEIVGPFEEENADPKQMMVKLQYLLLAIGTWKIDEKKDKVKAKKDFENRLQEIKKMTFEFEETEFEKFEKEYGEKEIKHLDLTDKKTSEDAEEDSFKNEVYGLSKKYNIKEEEIKELGIGVNKPKKDNKEVPVFKVHFDDFKKDKETIEVLNFLSSEMSEEEQLHKRGFEESGKEFYFKRIEQVLRVLAQDLNSHNISGDDLQIVINYKNGETKKFSLRETFKIKGGGTPSNIIALKGLLLNKKIFESTDSSFESFHFESESNRITQNYLNSASKMLFTGISDSVNREMQSRGISNSLKLNPRVFSQYYYQNGYIKDLYLDLINESGKDFKTVMGAVNNKLAKNNSVMKDDLMRTLRPFIINAEMVNYLSLKGEKALLQQHYQEALFINGIFNAEDINNRLSRNILSLGNAKKHPSIKVEELLIDILKEEYKRLGFGEFNYEEVKQEIFTTAQKLITIKSNFVKPEAYQNLSLENKANIISKLFMMKKFKTDIKEFKEVGMDNFDFIDINKKTNLDMDFSNNFFASYSKIGESILFSKTKDKQVLLDNLRKEHENFSYTSKEIKLINTLLSSHHYGTLEGKVEKVPASNERAFQIVKSKEAKMIYNNNIKILKTFKKFEDSGVQTDFSEAIYEEWKDIERTDITTLDTYYDQDISNFITFLEEKAMATYSKKVVNTLVKVNKVAKAFGFTKAISLNRLILDFDIISKNSVIDSYEKETEDKYNLIREANIYNYVAKNYLNSNEITEEQIRAIDNLVKEFSSFDANTRSISPEFLANALLGKMIFDKELYDYREEHSSPEEINLAMEKVVKELKEKKEIIDSLETDNLNKKTNELIKDVNLNTETFKDNEESVYNKLIPKDEKGKVRNEKFKIELEKAIDNYINRELIDERSETFDTYTTAKYYTDAFKYTQSNIFWSLISEDKTSLDDPLLQPILEILKQDKEALELFYKSRTEELTEEELSKLNKETQEAIIKETEKYILNKIKTEDNAFHDKIKNKKLHSAIIDARLNMEVFNLMANKFAINEDGTPKSLKEIEELFNGDTRKAKVLHKYLTDKTSVIFFDTENLVNRTKDIYEISYITINEKEEVIYNQELIPTAFEGATKELYRDEFGFNEDEIKLLESSLKTGPWNSAQKAFENFFKAAKGKALVGQAIESEEGKSGDIERLNEAYERVMKSKVRKVLEKHHPRYEDLRNSLKEADSKDNIAILNIFKDFLSYDEETGELLTTEKRINRTFEILKEMNLEKYKEYINILDTRDRSEVEQNLYLEELNRLQYPFFSVDRYNNPEKVILNSLIEFGLTNEQSNEILKEYNEKLNKLIEDKVLYQKINKMYINPNFGLNLKEVDSEIVAIKYEEGNFVSEAFFRQEAFNYIAPQLLSLAKFQNDKNISVKEGLRINSFGKTFHEGIMKYDLDRTQFSPKINLLIGAAKEEYAKTNNKTRYLISLKQIEKEYNKENKPDLFEGFENFKEFSKGLTDGTVKQELLTKFTPYELKDKMIKKLVSERENYSSKKDEFFINNVKAFTVRLLNYGDPRELTVDLFRDILKLDNSIPEELIQNELNRFKNIFDSLIKENIKDRFEVLNEENDGELLREGEDIIYQEGLIGTFMETALWQTIGTDSQLAYFLGKAVNDFKEIRSRFQTEIDETNYLVNNKKIENENNKTYFTEQRRLIQDALLNNDEEALVKYFSNSPKYKNENEAMFAYRKFLKTFKDRLKKLKTDGFYAEELKANIKDGSLNSRSETKTKIEYIKGDFNLERRFLKQAIFESWEEINEELYTNKIHKTIDPEEVVNEGVMYSFYNKNIEKFDGSYEKSDFEYEDKLINNVRKAHQNVYRKQYQYQNLSKYQYSFFDMISAFKDSKTGEYNKEALLESLKFGFLGKNYKITFITKMNAAEKSNYERKVNYDREITLDKYRSEMDSKEQQEFDAINKGLDPLVENIYNTDTPTMKVININNINDLDNLLKLAERGEVGFTTNFDMFSAQKMMRNSVRLSPVLNFIHNTVNFVQKSLMLANPMFLINIATNAVRKNYESLLRQGKLREGTGRYMSEFGKAAEMDLIYKKHSMVNEKVLKDFKSFTEDPNDTTRLIDMIDNQIASIEDYLAKGILEDKTIIENLLVIKNKLITYKNEFNQETINEEKIIGVFSDYVTTYSRAGFISKMILNGYRQDSNLMSNENEDIINEIEKARFVNDIYKHNIIADPYELEIRKDIRSIQKALDNEIHNSFKHNTIINGVQTITKGVVKPFRYLSDWINRTSRIHSVALEMAVGNTEVEAYNKTIKKFFNYGEKGALEKEATVFFPFMSYAIRNLDYYLDLVNDPRYMDLMSDIAQGMRTWYSKEDDLSVSNFSNHFAMQRGWIPLGENYGIKLTDQMLNANKFITDTGTFVNARRNPLINGIERAIKSDENFDISRTMGFNSSFYGGGVQALNKIAGNEVKTPADLFPNVFYADNYTQYTPYKYRRQKFGDYRNLNKDLFFPDGTRRAPSRNPYTTAKNILYKNYVNQRLMKKYRRESL